MVVPFTWVVCAALIGMPKTAEGGRFAAGAMVQSRGIALLLLGLVLSELTRLGASGADPATLLGVEAASPGAGRSAGLALGAWVLLSGAAAPLYVLGGLAGLLGARLRRQDIVWAGGVTRTVLAPLLVLSALALAGSYATNPGAVASALTPELTLVACLTLLGLALRVSVRWLPVVRGRRHLAQGEALVASSRGPDPIDILQHAGLAESTPLYSSPAAHSQGGQPGVLDRLWRAAGGEGAAPDGLGEALDAIAADEAVLIPDLPGLVEERLLVATLSWAALSGRRALVVTDQADRLKAVVNTCLARLGEHPSGEICASVAELTSAEAEERLPALILMDGAGVSDAVLPYLAGPGVDFSAALGLVVVASPDRLSSIEAAHLHFTLARLRLHSRGGGRTRAALITATGSAEMLVAAQELLGTHCRRVPLSLKARAEVRVFRGRVHGGASRAAVVQAVRDSYALMVEGGMDVSVEDSTELLAAEELGPDQRHVALDPPGTLRAEVVLVVAGLSEIGPLHRLAGRREPGPEGRGQVIVVWVLPGPLSEFLLAPGRVANLHRVRGLPSPLPLSGASNPHLRRLHLTAALHEGEAWESNLRASFGDDAVTELLRDNHAQRVGRRSALPQGEGRVVRSWLLKPAPGRGRPDTARETVTPAALRLVDSARGMELFATDLITAPTRFYPYRVFGLAGRRYHVPPGGGIDRKAGALSVQPVGDDREPTVPGIGFVLQLESWSGGWDQLDEPGLSLLRRKANVRVTERVGSAQEYPSGRTFSFEPVESTFRTEVLLVELKHLEGKRPAELGGLKLVADLVTRALLLELRIEDDLLRAEPLVEGFAAEQGGSSVASLAFIDRHVGGLGIADLLTPHLLASSLRWARSALQACPCLDGCPSCSPPWSIELRVKQSALRMMGR